MHRIIYIKNNKRYDFTIKFKSKEHMIKKVAQYKKGAVGFKITRLSHIIKPSKYMPCSEYTQTIYSSGGKDRLSRYNENKTYIKAQG